MNSFLYISIVLIWGSTWIAIYFQLGEVPILVSIFYRFVLASLLLMPFMILTKRLQKETWEDHGFFALQGLCLFSLNFVCFYYATSYISSGLVSVIFSLACIYNAVNNWIFYKEPITKTMLIGSLFGVIGLSLIFYPEFKQTHFNLNSLKGIALSLLGTLFFSLANIISKRHSIKGIKPYTSISYGMIYGSIVLLLLVVIMNQSWVFSYQLSYVSSLIYLSTFGTIVAFVMYLTLVARIGPSQAAYATVLFPIVALFFSSIFEDYRWNIISSIGLLLVITGNIIVNLYRFKRS